MSKRLLDVVLGTTAAVLALPLIVLLAIASAVAFRSWPLFVQDRVGLDGLPFRIVKIRSLPRSAPAEAHKFAIEAIPLPRFATLLRATHLDELPQLWLVPLGRMSLVGPRPEMKFLHDQGDHEFAALRTSVRPGCTGLWQVSKAAAGLIWDTTEYDRFYVQNRSLRLDLWILARTFAIMTPLASQLSLDDVPRWAISRHRRVSVAGAPASRRQTMGVSNVLARQAVPLAPRVISVADHASLGDAAKKRASADRAG